MMNSMIQMRLLHRLVEMRRPQEKLVGDLRETAFVDALLVVFGCRMDKVSNECQPGQIRLDDAELGRKMVQWFDPGYGSLVEVVVLIDTMWCQESNLLMGQRDL